MDSPDELLVHRRKLAIVRDTRNTQSIQPNLHIMPECSALTIDTYNLWGNGQILRVKFIGGTEIIHKKVKKFAKEWENYANIKFSFVSDRDADIRISFDQHVGLASRVPNG